MKFCMKWYEICKYVDFCILGIDAIIASFNFCYSWPDDLMKYQNTFSPL